MFPGYWQNEQANETSFVDGWFCTGDMGSIDQEGYITIVDRAKDMILCGGENVYCAEVEAALHEHPSVQQAAVVGIPNRIMGELVAAVLVVSEAVSASEIRAFCQARLSEYKVPYVVEFVDRMPTTGSGKILKTKLRQDFASRQEIAAPSQEDTDQPVVACFAWEFSESVPNLSRQDDADPLKDAWMFFGTPHGRTRELVALVQTAGGRCTIVEDDLLLSVLDDPSEPLLAPFEMGMTHRYGLVSLSGIRQDTLEGADMDAFPLVLQRIFSWARLAPRLHNLVLLCELDSSLAAKPDPSQACASGAFQCLASAAPEVSCLVLHVPGCDPPVRSLDMGVLVPQVLQRAPSPGERCLSLWTDGTGSLKALHLRRSPWGSERVQDVPLLLTEVGMQVVVGDGPLALRHATWLLDDCQCRQVALISQNKDDLALESLCQSSLEAGRLLQIYQCDKTSDVAWTRILQPLSEQFGIESVFYIMEHDMAAMKGEESDSCGSALTVSHVRGMHCLLGALERHGMPVVNFFLSMDSSSLFPGPESMVAMSAGFEATALLTGARANISRRYCVHWEGLEQTRANARLHTQGLSGAPLSASLCLYKMLPTDLDNPFLEVYLLPTAWEPVLVEQGLLGPIPSDESGPCLDTSPMLDLNSVVRRSV
ncbi:MAG: AMP-binding enzyme, partial [bacterium]